VSENPDVPVSEDQLARVVADVSSGADDPQHVSSLVGAFMQRQPVVGHYVASYSKELSLEGVVLTLLHASVVARCVELAAGRRLKPAGAPDLDAAARGDEASEARLAADEPILASYLSGNVLPEDPTLGGPRREIALRLLRVISRALLDQ
jgi:hypothetical protein